MKQFTENKLFWKDALKEYTVTDERIEMITQPHTDLWQRTYYGFSNENAPALLARTSEKYFSFTVKTTFDSKVRFDQCGVIIYQDTDNWFKASIEYENEEYQRLGSVVTNKGYSDWATTDISAAEKQMWYRLSRRESDYCIENSIDGKVFKQMRIFHLDKGAEEISFGIYACSPGNSSFKAIFSQMEISECRWEAHKD